MITLNPKVDLYMADGCGRCALFATPQCKVNTWREGLEHLRTIVLECGLTEELKWSQPVYSLNDKNLILIGAFKESFIISFFKGALLKDGSGILSKPGENSQVTRWIKFTDIQQVAEMESTIKVYVQEAIEVEKSGLKVKLKTMDEYEIPEELQNKFDEDLAFKKAFDALTHGRKRGYLLHFSQPKQSETRTARIEKSMQKIFDGKGLNDYL